jgi:hypothetical protein
MPPRISRLVMHIRYILWRMFGASPFGAGGGSTDPLAPVREPKRGRPGGRSSAIALMEPEGNRQVVNAVCGPSHSQRFLH